MAVIFENLLHKFFNGKVPKLKDVAKEGVQKAEERRAKKVSLAEINRVVGSLSVQACDSAGRKRAYGCLLARLRADAV